MRHAAKIGALLLALVMVLAMAVPALASGVTPTGAITIKPTNNVSLKDRTFKAYKLLDVEKVGTGENSYVYTVPAGLKAFYLAQFTDLTGEEPDFDAQVASKISAKSKAELFQFAKAAVAAGAPEAGTGTPSGDNYVISGLEMGYYAVVDQGEKEPVSAILLDTVEDTNKEVFVKADTPSVDKNILEGDPEAPTKANNASIGDIVKFQITSNVPDMAQYEEYFFILHDTLSKGLQYVNDAEHPMTVKIGETTINVCEDPAGEGHEKCYYTNVGEYSETNGQTLDIVFKNFIQYKELKGQAVTVTYYAKVTKAAELGTNPNTNTVNLEYSNDPSVKDGGKPGKPDEPNNGDATGETPNSTTKTYVTQIKLTKVDSEQQPLAGAQFKITGTKLNTVLVTAEVFNEATDGTYWKLANGSYTTTDPTDAPDAEYDAAGKKYKKETKQDVEIVKTPVELVVESGENGMIDIKGLGAGDYTITEVKAPDGYNMLGYDINLTIGWTKPDTADGDCTWTYTWKKGDTVDAEAGDTYEYQVVNVAGTILPSTGGMGTTIFYVVGSILLVGAAVLLIVKRRMGAEK